MYGWGYDMIHINTFLIKLFLFLVHCWFQKMFFFENETAMSTDTTRHIHRLATPLDYCICGFFIVCFFFFFCEKSVWEGTIKNSILSGDVSGCCFAVAEDWGPDAEALLQEDPILKNDKAKFSLNSKKKSFEEYIGKTTSCYSWLSPKTQVNPIWPICACRWAKRSECAEGDQDALTWCAHWARQRREWLNSMMVPTVTGVMVTMVVMEGLLDWDEVPFQQWVHLFLLGEVVGLYPDAFALWWVVFFWWVVSFYFFLRRNNSKNIFQLLNSLKWSD